MHLLSKSTFVKGHQCSKALYLHKYHPDLKGESDDSTEAVFQRGTDIGLLARNLFPDGIDASPDNYFEFGKAVSTTKKLLTSKTKVIYEASFIFNEVYVALDILRKDVSGYKAIEVKSSTSVNETYILDAALQYYVLTGAGIKLKDFLIVFINSDYIRKGNLNIKKLFNQQSVLKEVLELQPLIKEKIEEFKLVLKKKQIPTRDIGTHCNNPYPCDFMGHCWKHVPEYSVFDLANLSYAKKFELYKMGFAAISKIPNNYKLGDKQWQQVHCELSQKSIIEKDKIREFIHELNYPLYFMDFETFQLPVPVFDNCRPYQQMVFQYSLHKLENKKAREEHYEFLAEANGKDPRKKFIERLIKDCGNKGDILVYNLNFEKACLNKLALDFPEHERPINALVNRLKDLMLPFFKRWYYTPAMRGSYSIKQVLPALIPRLTYDKLEINNGGMASETFAAMVEKTFEGNLNKTRKALLEYCKLDTYAMVKILEKLQKV